MAYPRWDELTDATAPSARWGGPSETLYLSRLSEAISSVLDEDHHEVVVPAVDVGAATNELHVLGTVTFQDY